MTIWKRYTVEERSDYKKYLEIYGALSAMFNQKSSGTGAPYLDSKFQETVYARSFDSEGVDIGNTPHDIRSIFGIDKVGIGIKTWLGSGPSFQKVMQLKSYKGEINPYINTKSKDSLAYVISKIKNDRLVTDYKRLGLTKDKNIYHYVTRDRDKGKDKGLLKIFETSYPLIDIDKLKPGKLTKTSFCFSDSHKEYRYTFSDNQLWMRFADNVPNTYQLDQIEIDILKDPFTFLRHSFESYKLNKGVYIPASKLKRDYLYLPLYSYETKTVEKHSGLNAWNGLPKTKGSTKPRPRGEAYIPIPKALWKKKPNWVDPKVDMSNRDKYKQDTGNKGYQICLHLPDDPNHQILATFTQADFKSLQTNPQSKLGEWILNILGIKNPQRVCYNEDAKEIVTMDLLKKKGYDSVKLWHEDTNNYKDVWIDFAEYGSFEKFMNDEL